MTERAQQPDFLPPSSKPPQQSSASVKKRRAGAYNQGIKITFLSSGHSGERIPASQSDSLTAKIDLKTELMTSWLR